MPANEQTWRNIPRMHRVFAISGVALLIATIWVFWNDQNREWRGTQDKNVKIDTQMIQWRKQQYQTDAANSQHEDKAIQKAKADAEFIDPALIAAVHRAGAKVPGRYAGPQRRLQRELRSRRDRAATEWLRPAMRKRLRRPGRRRRSRNKSLRRHARS